VITIQQVLKDKGEKGNEIWWVPPDATLKETLRLMAEKDIGAVVILDQGQAAGIFTERDFARQAVSETGISLEDPISKVMTKMVYYVHPDQTIDECMALMTQKHFRHLPVLQNNSLSGVVSIGDVVKTMISEKDIAIRGLENFILGREYNG
jgi:CBS domain-containing protein